jgi:hypothetical protein
VEVLIRIIAVKNNNFFDYTPILKKAIPPMVPKGIIFFTGAISRKPNTRPSQPHQPLVKSAPGTLYPSFPYSRKKGLEKK